jgi:alpha-amylase
MHPRTHPRAWRNPAAPTSTAGDGRDVLLQGFHWDSHRGNADKKDPKGWYRIVKENAAAIKQAGFTCVWFPPPSDSLAPQGYIPRRWDVLDSAYGGEAELRAAIAALAPVRAMADLVLNHRVGVHTGGADFADPPFPDSRAAIAGDDESGVGTGAADTGERHPAGRDLDHTNPDVRAAIKRYLGRLKEVGFAGWRYDLCKGFAGRYVGEYNDASSPLLSVGEVFETDRQRVTDWIDSTGGKSSAFDFPTRYLLYEATLGDDYSGLRRDGVPGGLIGYWPGRAVTFVDNHDTESRREREHEASYDSTRHFHGPTVEMAYAYTLTHPGVPCVFWSHYFDFGPACRETIARLMRARRVTGVHSESRGRIAAAEGGLYAAVVDERLAVKLGGRDWSPPGRGWQLVASGERFAVWADE